jgi:hypothetical protein
MNNNQYIFLNCFYIRGFAPNPTSFFVLKQRTKQENSSQNDRLPALLQGRYFRQSGQVSLPKFQALQRSHPWRLHVLAGPAHGTLNLRHHNACGANKQIPYSDGLPFKRRRQPECVQTVSLLWLLSVTTESDRNKG